MSQMSASPQQIQAAAAAGVELLSDKDMKVPLGVAIGGQLAVLSGMLNAIAAGELVLQAPPAPEQSLEDLTQGETSGETQGEDAS